MQQFFNQLLQFLQQGISAIFRFVQLIWTWSVDQINSLVQVPWQDWPLWKQILLVLVIVGVGWALYKPAEGPVGGGRTVLGAFATLLGVLVGTLPRVMVAGLIALGGVWVLNNLDLSGSAAGVSSDQCGRSLARRSPRRKRLREIRRSFLIRLEPDLGSTDELAG
jgi:hypothetical protein